MKNYFSLQLPVIEGFEATYYFRDDPMRVYPAQRFVPHMHDSIEFYVLLEGDASFVVEHSLYRLEAGDIIITKPNEIHHCILNSDSKHVHLCFWLRPTSEFLFADFLRHDFGNGNLITPPPEVKKQLLSHYGRLREASENDDKRCEFYLLLELMDIFSKHMEEHPATIPFPPMLQSILEDIDTNFLEIKALEYFGERFFISPSTLNRLFRVYLHTTPKLYLETKRLAHSRQLLRQGKSVLAACMESGFSDSSNYIRLFKKRFGVTPKQYREAPPSDELRIYPK